MDLTALRPVAEKLFADVRELSFDGVGVTRESYGPRESATADLLRRFAETEGLATETDRAGNLVFTLPDTPADVPAVWCGSHIDSVPQGGNYDGLAGVVAGLLCLIEQGRSGVRSPLPLHVPAFRGEESAWFGKAYVGSSALLGKLDHDDLELRQRDSGKTLRGTIFTTWDS